MAKRNILFIVLALFVWACVAMAHAGSRSGSNKVSSGNRFSNTSAKAYVAKPAPVVNQYVAPPPAPRYVAPPVAPKPATVYVAPPKQPAYVAKPTVYVPKTQTRYVAPQTVIIHKDNDSALSNVVNAVAAAAVVNAVVNSNANAQQVAPQVVVNSAPITNSPNVTVQPIQWFKFKPDCGEWICQE